MRARLTILAVTAAVLASSFAGGFSTGWRW
jgi:hypothetical protein